MSAPLWTLYNNKTEQTVEGLTPEKAVAFIGEQLGSELEFWFVWFEGLASWEPVVQRDEFAAAVTREDDIVTQPVIPSAPPAAAANSARAVIPEVAPGAALQTGPVTEAHFEIPEESDVPAETSSDSESDLEKTQFDYDPSFAAREEKTAVGFDEETSTGHIQAIEQLDDKTVTHVGYDPEQTLTAEVDLSAEEPEAPLPQLVAGAVTEKPTHKPTSKPKVKPVEVIDVAGTPVAGTPVAGTPVAAAALEKAKIPTVALDEEPAIHIFWMADSPADEPTVTTLNELSDSYRAGGPLSGNLKPNGPAETALADAAVHMPDNSGPHEKGGAERREFERFEIRYRVIVRNENLTFRTFSKNISLGGVALEMAVPEAMLGSDCQIYVGNPKTGENIRFSGKLVPNRSDAKYFLFLKSSAESLLKLQKWVESHSTAKKKSA